MRYGFWQTPSGRYAWRCSHVYPNGDGCNWARNYATQAEAEIAAVTHRCEWRGDKMPAHESIVDQAWAQLDAQVDEIMELDANVDAKVSPTLWHQLVEAKARARGKAEILGLILGKSADEISQEAGARWQQRQS